MKNKKFLNGFIVSTIMGMMLFTSNIFASEIVDFKSITESEVWLSSVDRSERVDMLQLDTAELEKLSTTELIKLFNEYPFASDFMFFNDYSEFVEKTIDEFNGLEELLNRDDFADELIKYYSNKALVGYSRANSIYDATDMEELELLLGYAQINGLFDANDIKEVEDALVMKQAGLARTINEDDGLSFNIYKSMINGNNKQARASKVYVTTPRGSSVLAYVNGEELSASDKKAYANNVANNYPNATLLSAATTNYNCHSYAWYNASTNNKYWINVPSSYMKDGSYSISAPVTGAKLHYSYGDHSAIITSGNSSPTGPYSYTHILAKSKWGPGPLMSHYGTDSPYSTFGMKSYK